MPVDPRWPEGDVCSFCNRSDSPRKSKNKCMRCTQRQMAGVPLGPPYREKRSERRDGVRDLLLHIGEISERDENLAHLTPETREKVLALDKTRRAS